MSTSGIIILNTNRQILVFTPGAEDLLGWRGQNVEGMDCRVVMDCRGPDGASLCAHCDAACALQRQEMTPPRVIEIAEATGGRASVTTSFCYLPPSGFISEPRVMAVLKPAPVVAALH